MVKPDKINNEVTHCNPKEEMFNSKTGPSDVNKSDSNFKTPSEKEVQKNNTRVRICTFDANPRHLLRQILSSII